ncbi:hypothetical protein CP556_02650 [Natrinema sp. CBA1119]|uniref:helix-turn-helix domain-containing protein n=1 Tax=Natrinema sp. CBA1119 TaxID=1608465 RepID=UPI000BF9B6CD|nr:hypothetical protein CP556_02650 [Natrinema sp. CBA1119]
MITDRSRRRGRAALFWVTGTESDVDAFSAAARTEPAIERLTAVDTVGDRTLFRAEWAEDVDGVITGIETAVATVLEATGSAVEWQFELRFADHSCVRTFQRYCTAHDIEIDLVRIRHLVDPEPTRSYGLTDIQRETLALAYARGYFREPRAVSLAELAAEFVVIPLPVDSLISDARLISDLEFGMPPELVRIVIVGILHIVVLGLLSALMDSDDLSGPLIVADTGHVVTGAVEIVFDVFPIPRAIRF